MRLLLSSVCFRHILIMKCCSLSLFLILLVRMMCLWKDQRKSYKIIKVTMYVLTNFRALLVVDVGNLLTYIYVVCLVFFCFQLKVVTMILSKGTESRNYTKDVENNLRIIELDSIQVLIECTKYILCFITHGELMCTCSCCIIYPHNETFCSYILI